MKLNGKVSSSNDQPKVAQCHTMKDNIEKNENEISRLSKEVQDMKEIVAKLVNAIDKAGSNDILHQKNKIEYSSTGNEKAIMNVQVILAESPRKDNNNNSQPSSCIATSIQWDNDTFGNFHSNLKDSIVPPSVDSSEICTQNERFFIYNASATSIQCDNDTPGSTDLNLNDPVVPSIIDSSDICTQNEGFLINNSSATPTQCDNDTPGNIDLNLNDPVVPSIIDSSDICTQNEGFLINNSSATPTQCDNDTPGNIDLNLNDPVVPSIIDFDSIIPPSIDASDRSTQNDSFLMYNDSHTICSSTPQNSSKRKRDRRNCCPYCEKLVTNFVRHLMSHRKGEDDVRRLISIKNSDSQKQKVERTKISSKLRNKGNYAYNLKIAQNMGDNQLLPRKCPDKNRYQVNNVSHVVCKFCLGLYKKELMFAHVKKCEDNNLEKYFDRVDDDGKEIRNRVLKSSSLMLCPEIPPSCDAVKKKVFPRMDRDHISMTAQSDPLIVKFGERILKNHKGNYQVSYVSVRMRDLAM